MILKVISIIFKVVEGHRLIAETKKKGLLAYLKVLQMLRKSILAMLFVIFIIQIFIFSMIGFVLCGLYLAPFEVETKVWILFSLCAFVISVIGVVLSYLFSEKTWFNLSGVKDQISR